MGEVVHICNPVHVKTQTGGSEVRLALFTQRIQGQLGLPWQGPTWEKRPTGPTFPLTTACTNTTAIACVTDLDPIPIPPQFNTMLTALSSLLISLLKAKLIRLHVINYYHICRCLIITALYFLFGYFVTLDSFSLWEQKV